MVMLLSYDNAGRIALSASGIYLDNCLYQRQSGTPLPLTSCSWRSSGLMLLNVACALPLVRGPSIPPPRLFNLRSPVLSESTVRPPRYVGVDCAPWGWSSCEVAGWWLWMDGSPDREPKSAHAGVLNRTAVNTSAGITRIVCMVAMMTPPVQFSFRPHCRDHDSNEPEH